MFGFVKRTFVSAMMFFGCNLSSVNPLECISMGNQERKVRPEIINVNSLYFFLSVLKQTNAMVVATISMIHMQN